MENLLTFDWKNIVFHYHPETDQISQIKYLNQLVTPTSTPTPLLPSSSSSNQDHLYSGLTFNVNLSEQERETKDNLILPFMHHLKQQDTLPDPQSAVIFYEDEDHDFDEEDPDDDLDL